MTYRFSAELWLYRGEGPWHFVTLPFEMSDEIDERTTGSQGGFGSVKVHVTIGTTTWSTSLFPSAEAKSYILPIKQKVRTTEGLRIGVPFDIELRLANV